MCKVVCRKRKETTQPDAIAIHAHGPTHTASATAPGYVPVPYLERMDLAYAAADVALCRAGAMTVAEVSAVGLPAVYVPLPHGNGEQALNARPVVDAGGGRLVDDADLDGDRVLAEVTALLGDPERLAATARAARASGHAGADETLARTVLELAADREADGGAHQGPGEERP